MPEVLVSLVPWILGGVVLVGIVVSLVFNVSGTWERMPSDEEQAELEANPYRTPARERLVLGQFGPFVTGRRDVLGGWQEFGGTMLFSTLRLTRRDHGLRALTSQGFPEPIAKLIDGDVTGKLRLHLTAAGLLLDGSFTPQKIEFTHRPPRITSRFFLDPTPRRYRRLTAEEIAGARELVASQVEEQPT
ncbi:MAG: hypothetical protein ABIJ09_12740 [Pseudomonadota bacterium]